MKYTPYFSQLLKLNGTPHLSQDMFAVYMNIVHLEGRIAQLQDLANTAEQNDQKFVYRLKIDAIQEKVLALTQGMEPKAFLNTMVKQSLA